VQKPNTGGIRYLLVGMFLWLFALQELCLFGNTLSYGSTEWLIDYRAGFVRRGFFGEGLYLLAGSVGISPRIELFVLQSLIATSYLIVMLLLVWKNREKLGFMGSIVVLFNPVVLIFVTTDTIGLPEVLFVLISIWHMYLAKKSSETQYLFRTSLLLGILGSIAALQHEAFIFLAIPFNMLLTIRTLKTDRLQNLVKIYTLPILASLACIVKNGTVGQRFAINDGWTGLGLTLPSHTAINYLGWTAIQGVTHTMTTDSPTKILKFLFGAICFVTPILYLVGVSCQGRGVIRWLRLNETKELFLIPLACSLPLFVLASNWNRWLADPVILYASWKLMNGAIRLPENRLVRIGLACVSVCFLLFRFCGPQDLISMRAYLGGPIQQTLHWIHMSLK